ncbi:purine nucleoside permease [Dendrothele bispora CBS 962.96]|uniref:Purine nucleoside permease n=1 Tax=Dendrothele bispora (strain CBS 962.96) TaxID=1314807 RepID=A0A4S8KSN3_DENBC|nr:purine nucleoside permease [Dendrothele bispora CBS 962.96]
MFTPEANIWYNIPEFNLLAQNITVPGFSPLFPDAHCTRDGSICQAVTGEAEINAAVTITSLLHSAKFDLRQTYFLIAGIAGINPKLATTGSVTFARYAVQVALQYEIDAREIPSDFPTGYFPQGSQAPGQYPGNIYGTEVFEVNDDLRQLAFKFARKAKLNDTAPAQAYRTNYANESKLAKGAEPPSVVLCDTATSDNYWVGTLLAEAFENTTTLLTNGTGVYCSTQQEDNATLESLMRGAISGLVDFSRIIIMRTASDFDRPFSGQTAAEVLFAEQGGFDPAVTNIYVAGIEVVKGIINGWHQQFQAGVKPSNYIGDIFGSLGGQPDFGPGSEFGGQRAPSARRSMKNNMMRRT